MASLGLARYPHSGTNGAPAPLYGPSRRVHALRVP